MNSSDILGKLKSRYLWGNLCAMALVVLALVIGVKFALDAYTHHGEAITVPNLKDKRFADADRIMADLNLVMVVNDTGYVKTCLLYTSPSPRDRQKSRMPSSA